jgi:hypothetical protein
MLSLSKPCPGLDPGTKGEETGRGTLDPRDKPEDDSIHHCHPGRSAQARRAGILSEAYDVEQTAKIPDRHALRMASGMTGGAVGAPGLRGVWDDRWGGGRAAPRGRSVCPRGSVILEWASASSSVQSTALP